jgi:hypothetical protein
MVPARPFFIGSPGWVHDAVIFTARATNPKSAMLTKQ